MVDGSITSRASLRGQLLLQLRAGTHTVGLQWLASSNEDKTAIAWMDLNTMADGFLGGGDLLVIVNMQKNAPRLVRKYTSIMHIRPVS